MLTPTQTHRSAGWKDTHEAVSDFYLSWWDKDADNHSASEHSFAIVKLEFAQFSPGSSFDYIYRGNVWRTISIFTIQNMKPHTFQCSQGWLHKLLNASASWGLSTGPFISFYDPLGHKHWLAHTDHNASPKAILVDGLTTRNFP